MLVHSALLQNEMNVTRQITFGVSLVRHIYDNDIVLTLTPLTRYYTSRLSLNEAFFSLKDDFPALFLSLNAEEEEDPDGEPSKSL